MSHLFGNAVLRNILAVKQSVATGWRGQPFTIRVPYSIKMHDKFRFLLDRRVMKLTGLTSDPSTEHGTFITIDALETGIFPLMFYIDKWLDSEWYFHITIGEVADEVASTICNR